MHILTRAAVTAAATAGFCLAIALPASATPTPTFTVNLQHGQAPTTATEFGGNGTDCGNAPNQDGWYFVLPGTPGATMFQSLTLTFTGGSEIGSPDIIQSGKKALVETTPGATLTGGTAQVTTTSGQEPDKDFFVLSHTCAATSSTSPSSSSPTPGSSSSTASSPGPHSSVPAGFPSGGVQTGGGKPAPGSLWIPAGIGLSGLALLSSLIGLARRRLARR